MSPVLGLSILSYIILLFASVYVALKVRKPIERIIYLFFIAIIMIAGAFLVRIYLITPAGYEVITEEGKVITREIYRDEPYSPAVSGALLTLSLIPVVLSIPAALEMFRSIGRRR